MIDPLTNSQRASDSPLVFVAERGTPWAGGDDLVTLDEAKAHLRVTHTLAGAGAALATAENALITRLIRASRLRVEDLTNRSLLASQWKMTLPRFPRGSQPIRVPRPPLVSITSVAYVDSDGNAQTLDEGADGYVVDSSREPAQLFPGIDAGGWPSTQRDTADAVVVTFQAGYADAESVPADLVAAALQLLGGMYEHREPQAGADIERAIRYMIGGHILPEVY